MQTRDVIYIVGIMLSITLGVFSFFISIKNRRNAIREHIYKEQFNFFLKVLNELNLALTIFYDSFANKKLVPEKDKELETIFAKLYQLQDTHDFITPNEIVFDLTNVIMQADNLHVKAIKNPITEEEISTLHNNYFKLEDKIREFFGSDKLSDENRKLYQRRVKKTKPN